MEKRKNPVDYICLLAGMLGACSGWCSSKFPKLKNIFIHYLIVLLIVIAATVAYVEIGHSKGWKRADVWYTCLHTHHHFFWQ